MDTNQPLAPDVEHRVRESFNRQGLIHTLNGELSFIEPGLAHIEMPFDQRFTQQNGFLHAGIVTTLMDSACGYAAFTLMPADARVLTIEFKINLLAPAAGDSFRAVGRVRKPGRSVFVAESELHASGDSGDKLVATMVGTLMAMQPR